MIDKLHVTLVSTPVKILNSRSMINSINSPKIEIHLKEIFQKNKLISSGFQPNLSSKVDRKLAIRARVEA